MGGHVRWCEQPQALLALCHELDRWYRMPYQANLRLYVLRNIIAETDLTLTLI